MKKPGIWLLIICFIFGAFTGGFFIGRNANHATVQFSAPSALPPAEHSPTEGTGTSQAEVLVNINTATAEQLQTLPNIGEVLALRIISYREEHGGFSSVAELANVEGIGAKRLQTILDYITTGG